MIKLHESVPLDRQVRGCRNIFNSILRTKDAFELIVKSKCLSKLLIWLSNFETTFNKFKENCGQRLAQILISCFE